MSTIQPNPRPELGTGPPEPGSAEQKTASPPLSWASLERSAAVVFTTRTWLLQSLLGRRGNLAHPDLWRVGGTGGRLREVGVCEMSAG
eukprot:COSAG04_NODE_3190_length_3070_cov_1.758667_7_plen_87_part_01